MGNTVGIVDVGLPVSIVGVIVRRLSGVLVGVMDGTEVGFDGQSTKFPNCTSNPLGPPSFWTVKVIVVTDPKPVAVKDDIPTKPLYPSKEFISVEAVPFHTTTESRRSSAAKKTSRDKHDWMGSEKVV